MVNKNIIMYIISFSLKINRKVLGHVDIEIFPVKVQVTIYNLLFAIINNFDMPEVVANDKKLFQYIFHDMRKTSFD